MKRQRIQWGKEMQVTLLDSVSSRDTWGSLGEGVNNSFNTKSSRVGFRGKVGWGPA